jgi:hypothetical protein
MPLFNAAWMSAVSSHRAARRAAAERQGPASQVEFFCRHTKQFVTYCVFSIIFLFDF